MGRRVRRRHSRSRGRHGHGIRVGVAVVIIVIIVIVSMGGRGAFLPTALKDTREEEEGQCTRQPRAELHHGES